jgi:hypothetical protein
MKSFSSFEIYSQDGRASRVSLGTAGPSVTKVSGKIFSPFTADERIVLAESVLPYLSPSDRQLAPTRQPATIDLQLYPADGKPVDLAYKELPIVKHKCINGRKSWDVKKAVLKWFLRYYEARAVTDRERRHCAKFRLREEQWKKLRDLLVNSYWKDFNGELKTFSNLEDLQLHYTELLLAQAECVEEEDIEHAKAIFVALQEIQFAAGVDNINKLMPRLTSKFRYTFLVSFLYGK